MKHCLYSTGSINFSSSIRRCLVTQAYNLNFIELSGFVNNNKKLNCLVSTQVLAMFIKQGRFGRLGIDSAQDFSGIRLYDHGGARKINCHNINR